MGGVTGQFTQCCFRPHDVPMVCYTMTMWSTLPGNKGHIRVQIGVENKIAKKDLLEAVIVSLLGPPVPWPSAAAAPWRTQCSAGRLKHPHTHPPGETGWLPLPQRVPAASCAKSLPFLYTLFRQIAFCSFRTYWLHEASCLNQCDAFDYGAFDHYDGF